MRSTSCDRWMVKVPFGTRGTCTCAHLVDTFLYMYDFLQPYLIQ